MFFNSDLLILFEPVEMVSMHFEYSEPIVRQRIFNSVSSFFSLEIISQLIATIFVCLLFR